MQVDKNTDKGKVSEVKATILERHVMTGFSDAVLSPNLTTSNKTCAGWEKNNFSCL